MEMSESERVELGERIRQQRERLFGTKKAAYQEAGVNAGTWDRAEAGEAIRGDRLRSIVRTLWPASEGDWTAIDETGRVSPSLEDRVAALERLIRNLADDNVTSEDEKPETPGVSA